LAKILGECDSMVRLGSGDFALSIWGFNGAADGTIVGEHV